jgi:HSP20 family protein
MAIQHWDPFHEMISLRDAMNSLLQESFIRPGMALADGGRAAGFPLDVRETPEEFVVTASLPGVRPEDLRITAHGDTLIIDGESRAEQEKQGEHWHLRERKFGSFHRSVTLGMPIDPDKAKSHFEHGVLTLTLPKSEQAKPKQIKVGGGSAQALGGGKSK